jgi:hypothetical protein
MPPAYQHPRSAVAKHVRNPTFRTIAWRCREDLNDRMAPRFLTIVTGRNLRRSGSREKVEPSTVLRVFRRIVRPLAGGWADLTFLPCPMLVLGRFGRRLEPV